MINYEQLIEKYLKLGVSKKDLPTKEMIKTPEQIEGIRYASICNTKILDAVDKEIKIGMSTQDIDDIVARETKKYEGQSAPLEVNFPKCVCTSVNDCVCHGIPSKNVILKEGDIVNVDVETKIKGYYGDSSRMYMMGKVDPIAKELVEVTKEALDLCVKEIKPFMRLGDIGYIINKHVTKHGFSVVREIGGHGVGVEMHEDPYVCHYGKKDTGMVLFPGMVFTIEPMINEGDRHVFLDSSNDWEIYTQDGLLSAQWEYTLLMTEEGLEILSK